MYIYISIYRTGAALKQSRKSGEALSRANSQFTSQFTIHNFNNSNILAITTINIIAITTIHRIAIYNIIQYCII